MARQFKLAHGPSVTFIRDLKKTPVRVNVWRMLMDLRVLAGPSGMLASWMFPQELGSVWTTFWTNALCKVPFRPEQTQENGISKSKETVQPYSPALEFSLPVFIFFGLFRMKQRSNVDTVRAQRSTESSWINICTYSTGAARQVGLKVESFRKN